ncbi:SusC/RagA family TonB-linked outer membrane protein [Reichenbachiella versicolor]|uniref:SusC/RagA family TonB-linked outer membrane protein n=1 Tax=Reichenbachiella versicolor TaxID=1821036 RepID=UPI000D6EA69A|nr:TonB-dependent receptor [Reichenbachiella versicolor]
MKRLRTKMRVVPIILCLLLGSLSVTAQSKVSGKVTDPTDGSGLPGVNILVKGTTSGTVSDIDGNYTISVSGNDVVLSFSFIGYKTKDVPVGGKAIINVQLENDVEMLEEVVKIGYGEQKKIEVTGAVGSIKSEELVKNATSDVASALQGQIAGVNIQSAGSPGEPANIQIRGLGSLSEGALSPLFVVDGIPYDQDPNIAPEQIESVEVLKDGASAAIYGVRASNGVILITTKRAKEDQMKVSLSAYRGIQNITSGTPLLNTPEQIYVNTLTFEQVPRPFQNGETDILERNTDFVGEVQNDNAVIQRYNIDVSGGSKALKLTMNTNYFDQEGVLINSGYERLATRVNASFKKGKLDAFTSIGLSRDKKTSEPWGLYQLALRNDPWQRSLFDQTAISDTETEIDADNVNVYGYLARQLNNINESETDQNTYNFRVGYQFFKGFKVILKAGYNDRVIRRKSFRPQYLAYDTDGNLVPGGSTLEAVLEEDYNFFSKGTTEGVIQYNKWIKGHSFGVTGVISYETFDTKNVGVGTIGSLSNSTQVLSAGTIGIKPNGTDERRTLAGKLLRVQYNYKKKYLFSASLRYDGTSAFGEDNRYSPFFGVSGGWVLSDEKFFNNASFLDWMNIFKLRLSYAQLGNQSVRLYQANRYIENGVDYAYGPEGSEVLAVGAIQRRYPNEDIRWESSINRNIGIDMELLNSRIHFNFDAYYNTKDDMLLQEVLPPSTGTWHPGQQNVYNVRNINAGDMLNKGIEVAVSYTNNTSYGLKWKLGLTFTKNINEITDLNGVEGLAYPNGRPARFQADRTDYTTFMAKGYPAASFFLLEHEGVIKSDVPNGDEFGFHPETGEELSQLTAYQLIDPTAELGDNMFTDQLTVDTDGDGVPDQGDGILNDEDRVYKGSTMPKFESGFTADLKYKGFDFFFQTYLSYGAKIYNGPDRFAYVEGRHKDVYYMWSPQNPESDIAIVRRSNTHNNYRTRTDIFLEDGSFLRVKNITLGYTFPKKWTGNNITKLRVYATAQNPFTFTKYTGYDPEVAGNGITTRGVDVGNYPVTRQFLGGIQIDF